MEQSQSQTAGSVAKNVLYGFSTWVLPIGLSFYATPKIVRGLGEQDYGIYALILGFVGYSFNFSFGRAIIKYIAEYRSRNENEKISGLLSAALFISVVIGLISVVIICLSSRWLVEEAFKINVEAQSKTTGALYLTSLIVFVLMQNQIFSSVLQGIHRFDIYSKILNFNNLILLAGNLLLAVNGFGLIGLFAWNLAVTALSGVIFIVSAKRHLPELKLTLKFNIDDVKLIIFYSSGIIGAQILGNVIILFERGWITRQLGSYSLTYYVVPLMLAFYIHGFVMSFIMVVFPLASELKDDREKLLRLYTKATKIVCLFVFFFAATLITEGRFFLTLWMGAEFAARSYDLLIIQTIAFSFLAIQMVSWQMTDGLGYSSYNFYLLLLCLVITISLMILLIKDFGAEGVAFARMIGLVVVFLSIFYVEKWVFSKIQKIFWLKLIGILTLSSVLSTIAESFIIKNFAVSWLTFVAATAVGGVFYGLCAWFLKLISEDEKKLIRRILKIQTESP